MALKRRLNITHGFKPSILHHFHIAK